MTYLDKVKELFPSTSNYYEDPKNKTVSFTVPTKVVTFHSLDLLSETLGTEMIDLCTEPERNCDSSFGFRSQCAFECRNIPFPQEAIENHQTTEVTLLEGDILEKVIVDSSKVFRAFKGEF
jgi:hypothetical protein